MFWKKKGDKAVVPALGFEERVSRMFRKYEPQEERHAAFLVKQYAGRETVLLSTLVKKYGPEPTASEVLPPATRSTAAAAPTLATPPPSHPSNVHNLEGTPPPILKVSQMTPSQGNGDGDAATTASPLGDPSWRERFEKVLAFYAPHKVKDLEKLMKSIAGMEAEIMAKFVAHYGPEPPATWKPAALNDSNSTSPPRRRSGVAFVEDTHSPCHPRVAFPESSQLSGPDEAARGPISGFTPSGREAESHRGPRGEGAPQSAQGAAEGAASTSRQLYMSKSILDSMREAPPRTSPATTASSTPVQQSLDGQQPSSSGSQSRTSSSRSARGASHAKRHSGEDVGRDGMGSRLRTGVRPHRTVPSRSGEADEARRRERRSDASTSPLRRRGSERGRSHSRRGREHRADARLGSRPHRHCSPTEAVDTYAFKHWEQKSVTRLFQKHAPERLYQLDYLFHAYRQHEEELYVCVSTDFHEPALAWQIMGAPPLVTFEERSLPPLGWCSSRIGGGGGRLTVEVRGARNLFNSFPPQVPHEAKEDPCYSVALCVADQQVSRVDGVGVAGGSRSADALPAGGDGEVFTVDFSDNGRKNGMGTVVVRSKEQPTPYVRFRVFQHKTGDPGKLSHPLFIGETALTINESLFPYGQQALELFNIPVLIQRSLPQSYLSRPMQLVVAWTFVPDAALDAYRKLLRRPIISQGPTASNNRSAGNDEAISHGEGSRDGAEGGNTRALQPWEETWDPWGQRLAALLCRYAPERLDEVTQLRSQNRDDMDTLIDRLCVKYGPEPEPEELRSRMERLLLHHDRHRLSDCAAYARQGPAFQEQLLESLIRQYGSEPTFRYTVPPRVGRAPHTLSNPYRQRLTQWIVSRTPRRAGEVDYYLRRFAGREELLFSLMADAIGPEHSFSQIDALRRRGAPYGGRNTFGNCTTRLDGSAGFGQDSRRDHLVTPALQNYFSARAAPPFLSWMVHSDQEVVRSDIGHSAVPASVLSGNAPSASTLQCGVTVRSRLKELLATYAPEKLEEAESMLERWRGREEMLLDTLSLRYTGTRGTDTAAAIQSLEASQSTAPRTERSSWMARLLQEAPHPRSREPIAQSPWSFDPLRAPRSDDPQDDQSCWVSSVGERLDTRSLGESAVIGPQFSEPFFIAEPKVQVPRQLSAAEKVRIGFGIKVLPRSAGGGGAAGTPMFGGGKGTFDASFL